MAISSRKRNACLSSLAVFCLLASVGVTGSASTVGYGYDNAGRLRSTTYWNSAQKIYVLDAAGNRVQMQTVTGATPPGTITTTPAPAPATAGSIANSIAYTATMVPGSFYAVVTGFSSSSFPFGSITAVNMGNGKSLSYFADETANSRVLVGGFTSDPGSTWLVSATTSTGVSNLGATATYSYSQGVATWQWASKFGFQVGVTTAVEIVHYP